MNNGSIARPTAALSAKTINRQTVVVLHLHLRTVRSAKSVIQEIEKQSLILYCACVITICSCVSAIVTPSACHLTILMHNGICLGCLNIVWLIGMPSMTHVSTYILYM